MSICSPTRRRARSTSSRATPSTRSPLPAALASLARLQHLHLQHNRLEGELPAAALQGWQALQPREAQAPQEPLAEERVLERVLRGAGEIAERARVGWRCHVMRWRPCHSYHSCEQELTQLVVPPVAL